MEVVVAIMLLFGAFSLGSAMHDGADADPVVNEPPAAPSEVQDVPTVGTGDGQHQECIANRHHVIYRDLTHALSPEEGGETIPPGDCDGACADE